MKKLYNTQSQITSDLSKFFKFVYPAISKPHLSNATNIIFGIIKSESVVTTDIIKTLKNPWCDSQPASIERKLQRFFNNYKFDSYSFYNYS